MTYIVSKKSNSEGVLLVVTDSEIIGKLFEEGKKQIDLTSEFYKWERKSKEHARELIKASRHVHLTGKQAVALGVKLGLVNPGRVLVVQGIPHATVIVEL